MDDIYSEVGRRMRAVRHQRGMTLEDVAELSGLNAAFIGQIERDVKKASLLTLVAVAGALDTPVRAFFSTKSPLARLPSARKIEAVLRGVTKPERRLLVSALRLLARELKKVRRQP